MLPARVIVMILSTRNCIKNSNDMKGIFFEFVCYDNFFR